MSKSLKANIVEYLHDFRKLYGGFIYTDRCVNHLQIQYSRW